MYLTLLPATACENDAHPFAGHCTEECAYIADAMHDPGYVDDRFYSDYLGGVSSIDVSGCRSGPPMPEERIEYDATNRAVVLVEYHPDGCFCGCEDEDLCNVSVTLGSHHDPYGTSCEREPNHDGPHRGRNPFGGDDHYEWEGGGMCAGDPLPVRNGRFV